MIIFIYLLYKNTYKIQFNFVSKLMLLNRMFLSYIDHASKVGNLAFSGIIQSHSKQISPAIPIIKL